MGKINNISDFNHCFGCGVCVNSCPKKIIKFGINEKGFFSPSIENQSNCLYCGICLKICSYNNNIPESAIKQCYAGWSNNEKSRNSSSSGGIAYEIAKLGIMNEYRVVGVRYDIYKKRAEHYIAETLDEISETKGSKYIQSYSPNGTINLFDGNKYIVFGTPCQIHSIRNAISLRKLEQHFILIDFFCHGVPSYLMWDKYVTESSDITGKLKCVTWRDKSNGGWHNSWNMILEGQKETKHCSLAENDLFYRFFLKNRCLNIACYDSCKYKMDNSAADIRLGDLWGEKYKNNEKGVSGIIILTETGQKIIDKLDNCTFIEESPDVVMESQMRECAKRPSSFNYVQKRLSSSSSLSAIDKRANIIEFIFDWIPGAVRYYPRRIIQKLFFK